MASGQKEPNGSFDSPDLRIVLLGDCGADKRAIGNAILNQEAFEDSRTRESEIRRGRAEGRNISIIDTPGFFNTLLTDEELKKQMKKSLDLSSPGPHVFLLIINLENFKDDQRNVVQKMMDNFGEEALRFTMVVFVGTEKVSDAEIFNSKETNTILRSFEERFHVLNNKDKCDPDQITVLLKSIDKMVKNYSGKHFSIGTKKEEMVPEMKELIREIVKERFCLESDLRIVLVGKTGSGKSSSGNTILGKRQKFKTEMSSKSVTRLCQKNLTEVEGKRILVIDTPGLYDTSISEVELKKEINKCVYMSAPGPHVFLLVIRIGRFTDEEKKTVEWIQKNFGKEADCYTIVLFTHADQLKGKDLNEYISENNDLQAFVNEFGGRFHSFNNDKRNQVQVIELMEKIKEMVKENGEKHYTNNIFETAQKLIENEAFKQKIRDYAQKALVVVGVGTVAVVGAGTLVGTHAGAVLASGAAVGAKVLETGAAKVFKIN